ncbi:hypothetical protein [Rhodococcus erythropolis]|uniref:hypothetical protein n=1 Tax=Rhodococcus erythropolis TaxID=1833 RepID=UPI003AF344C7
MATWPNELAVVQVRIARPTDRLDDVIAFYRDCLGLPELYRFSGHAGYDGIMLGCRIRTITSNSRPTKTEARARRRRRTTCWCSTSPASRRCTR